MSVNAQPAVRSGSLPTQTPQGVARQPLRTPAAAQPAAEPESAEVGAESTQVSGEKPKRKYNRKPKPQIDANAALSKDELAAWGQIALEARAAGLSVERFMADIEARYGLKLRVWDKLRAPAEETAAEIEPAVEA